jgi:hypothetical protein
VGSLFKRISLYVTAIAYLFRYADNRLPLAVFGRKVDLKVPLRCWCTHVVEDMTLSASSESSKTSSTKLNDSCWGCRGFASFSPSSFLSLLIRRLLVGALLPRGFAFLFFLFLVICSRGGIDWSGVFVAAPIAKIADALLVELADSVALLAAG